MSSSLYSEMIYLSYSDNPFRLKYEDDVSAIGMIEERLHSLLSDTMSIIVPPVSKWILKGFDVDDTTNLY